MKWVCAEKRGVWLFPVAGGSDSEQQGSANGKHLVEKVCVSGRREEGVCVVKKRKQKRR